MEDEEANLELVPEKMAMALGMKRMFQKGDILLYAWTC